MKIESIGKLFALGAVMGLVGTAPVMADDTPLAEQMDEVSASLKKLRRAPDFAAKAALVREGQAAVIKSLEYLPATFAKITDEKEKAKATADYKRLIGLTLASFAELELAFLAEDEEKADEIIDKLKDLKKEGHEAYVEEE